MGDERGDGVDAVIESDCTVVGGGVAGVCAALAAARQGISVALVNDRPTLGGSSSSEIRVHVSGATGASHDVKNRYAREGGIVEELLLRNKHDNPDGDPDLWDAILYDAVTAEDGATLHLNTLVHDVRTDGDRVTAVVGEQSGSGRTLRFESETFVDATGDGVVAVAAGAEWTQGPEAREAFGESLAPEEAGDETLSSTIMFTASERDHPVPFEPPSFARNFREDTPRVVERYVNHEDPAANYYWWIQYGGERGVDPVADDAAIRDELWAIVYGVWDYVKNGDAVSDEQSDPLGLDWVGKIPGKRESRRVRGPYVLTQDDLTSQRRFDDAVGHGGWFVDLHPPGGIEEPEGVNATDNVKEILDGPYAIPYRSLYARDCSNLLLAGRIVSASRIAFGSLRVQATLATTGQAVGTAAALCQRFDTTPAGIDENHVETVQQALLRDDQWVIGVPNRDSDDLAREATVTASGHRESAVERADRTIPLDREIGIHIPATGDTNRIELGVDAECTTELTVECWDERRPENYVPAEQRDIVSARTTGEGREWLTVPIRFDPGDGRGVFLRIQPDPAVSLCVASERLVGVLGCSSDPTATEETWQPADWVPCVRLDSDRLYAPESAVDGHARPYGLPHCWISEPFDSDAGESDAPWLELAWDEPCELAAVQVTFDSRLTQWYNNLGSGGSRAVPAVVRDYRIDCAVDDEWQTVADIGGNVQRRRRHRFDSVETNRCRIVPTATNGADRATVFEVRAYGPDGPFTQHQ